MRASLHNRCTERVGAMFAKRLTSIAIIIIAIGLIVFILIKNNPTEGVEQGNQAVDFTLPLWKGNESSLSDYRGTIVVMNAWASWCPPCRDEMPDLMQFYDDYKDKGVTVLGVNMYRYERKRTDPKDFLNEFNVNFPIVFDKEGEFAKTYLPVYLPTTYILDKEGVIKKIHNGEINYEGLQKLIDPML